MQQLLLMVCWSTVSVVLLLHNCCSAIAKLLLVCWRAVSVLLKWLLQWCCSTVAVPLQYSCWDAMLLQCGCDGGCSVVSQRLQCCCRAANILKIVFFLKFPQQKFGRKNFFQWTQVDKDQNIDFLGGKFLQGISILGWKIWHKKKINQ